MPAEVEGPQRGEEVEEEAEDEKEEEEGERSSGLWQFLKGVAYVRRDTFEKEEREKFLKLYILMQTPVGCSPLKYNKIK